MSYQVIARKYRPQNFEEVVGQSAIVETLKNALSAKRIHHAYLFTGARGIGKTSLARIFAKSLNCEKGPTFTPCNQCNSCKEITQGISLDVQEIDGASNTSVEDVRDLREGLKYMPASGRYKIFIIDEVHMLSTSAFNALLKTLEEPPAHVLFLFATTEVHKIPATILSRCQRFDLRRIPNEEILRQLQYICEQEKVDWNADTLLLIARESQGSLRDSQSLLDQAIAFSNGKLEIGKIASMLGLSDSQSIQEITQAIFEKNTLRAFEIISETYERGHDLKQFASQWLEYWWYLLLYRSTNNTSVIKNLTESEKQKVIQQSELTSVANLDVGIQVLHRALEEIGRSEYQKLLLDALIVRLVNLSDLESLPEILNQLKTNPRPLEASPSKVAAAAEPAISQTPPSVNPPRVESPSLKSFIHQFSQKRPQIGSLFQHLKASCLTDSSIHFQFEPGALWMELLNERKDQIEEAAKVFFNRPYRVLVQDTPLPAGNEELTPTQKESKTSNPIVQSALHILNAQIEEVNS